MSLLSKFEVAVAALDHMALNFLTYLKELQNKSSIVYWKAMKMWNRDGFD